MQVTWHRSLDAVPRGTPCVVIAHELFDALPVHQFVKTERGWVEKLVDVAEAESDAPLRFVLSPGATPASRILLPHRLASLSASARASSAVDCGRPETCQTIETAHASQGMASRSWR